MTVILLYLLLLVGVVAAVLAQKQSSQDSQFQSMPIPVRVSEDVRFTHRRFRR